MQKKSEQHQFFRKKTRDKPKLLQSIHQKLFARLYNLDYLQWLERNAKTQIAAIALLAILLSMTVYTLSRQQELQFDSKKEEIASVTLQEERLEQKQQPKKVMVEFQPDNQLAFQDTILTAQPSDNEKGSLVSEMEKTTTPEKKLVYINPLTIKGYVPPANGVLQHAYGVGYDAVYEDYRFHSDVCYLVENGEVFACVSGVIADVEPEEQWQIRIQCEEGVVCYSGLIHCTVQTGEKVTAGQPIGTAEESVSVQVIED